MDKNHVQTSSVVTNQPKPVNKQSSDRFNHYPKDNINLYENISKVLKLGSHIIHKQMDSIAGEWNEGNPYHVFTEKFNQAKPEERHDVVKAFLKATNQDESGIEPFMVYILLDEQANDFTNMECEIPMFIENEDLAFIKSFNPTSQRN